MLSKTIVNGVIAVLYAATAMAQPAGSSGDRTKEQLAQQERRVVPRVLPGSRMQQEVDAAAAFARAIAGDDDTRFVQTFQGALNLAVGIDEEGVGRVAFLPVSLRAAALSPQSIFRNLTYVRNARKLIAEAAAGTRAIGAAETTDFPDCVAVGGLDRWCCTGTLVSPRIVVSAGHCHADCGSRIFIGTSVAGEGETIRVVEALRHPEYGGENHNDLMLLLLEREVTSVTPRRIAPSQAIDTATSVRVVGYGNTDVWSSGGYGVRRAVDVPVASNSCTSPDAQSRLGCDEGLELVAGAPFLDLDSCNGDSGGPIYVQHEGEWFVAGATSRATNEALRPCGDGGIYVRLDKYKDWIQSVPAEK